MTDLIGLCRELQLDSSTAAEALARERASDASALAMPWFARNVIAIGAWITALSAIAVGCVILFMLIGTEYMGSLSVLGAIYLGLGLWLLERRGSRAFAMQLGTAVAAAGVAMIAAGIGIEAGTVWPALIAAALATAVVIAGTPNRTLQFLAAALVAVLAAITLVEERVPYYLDVAALAGPAGVFLLIRPTRRDLQPLAFVLLALFPLLDVVGADELAAYAEAPEAGGWFARALHVGLFLWLASLHWRHVTPDARARLAVFACTAVLVCLLLPPGGSAALVILMTAFIVGSRPLALFGILLQIDYIWRFYYDLQVSLLVKSGILVAVGSILLLGWWLMSRRAPEGLRL